MCILCVVLPDQQGCVRYEQWTAWMRGDEMRDDAAMGGL